MASTYSNLKIELIGTGDQAGTWGTTTNTNLGTAIEEAITGTADVPFSSADVTLTLTDTNTTQTARNLRLNLTGTSGGARNLIVPSIEKFYIVNNGLADAVTVKNSTGTGTAIPAGTSGFVFNNGTNVVAAINYFSGTFGTISAGSITGTSLSTSGNLTFTSTSNRILGDFTNATIASRVAFQTSTTDGNTVIGVLPNGTATGAAIQVYNNSTPTNSSLGSWEVSSTAVTIASSIRGSGTYLPLSFNVNGAEVARFLTTGAVSFGSSGTAYGTSGQVLTSGGAGASPTWTTITPGTGTVTSITAGTGLSGGTITTSGTISINTAVTVDVSTAQTLTNKRITPRSLAAANISGTITPDSDLYDQVNYLLTGTSAFANPSGTPTNGQKLSIRLYAVATQTISSWSGGGYRAIGTTLPTSVPAGKTIYVGCIWNSTDAIWDVVAVATQA